MQLKVARPIECRLCGTVFWTRDARAEYCSVECRNRARRQQEKEKHERERLRREVEMRKQAATERRKELAAINQRARAAGLSYGEYVARCKALGVEP